MLLKSRQAALSSGIAACMQLTAVHKPDTVHNIVGNATVTSLRHMCYTNLAAGPLVAGSRPAAFNCWCVGASISEDRTLPPPNILCRANAMAEAAQPQGSLSTSAVFDMHKSAGALSAVGMPFAGE